jgi:uncharacterized protein YjiS (DUF1127 family)
MEMTMSTIYGAPAAARGATGFFANSSPTAALRRWWAAYLTRRIRHDAMVALCAMSDQELNDIGVNRCDISRAVSGAIARDRTCRRHA